MERHKSSFSNNVTYGDDNVRFLPGKHTCAVYCRDRIGDWRYAGLFSNITTERDGRWRFYCSH